MMTMRAKCQVCKHKQEQLANDAGSQTNLGVRNEGKVAVQFVGGFPEIFFFPCVPTAEY